MRHKLETVVYAQGWLESQFENMLSIQTDEANKQVAEQINEMWKTLSEGLDDLIKEYATQCEWLDSMRQTLNKSQ